MISHRLWQRAFKADPKVIDKAIVMNGRAYWLAGVLPASFEPLISEHFYKAADVWALLGYDETLPYACRSCQHLRVIARLREGVLPKQAGDEVQTLQQQLQREHPSDYSATARMAVVPLNTELNRGLDRTVWMLMAAVGFVLLIACANVANLILARSDRRSRELALRVALGASRGRILRQMITEGLVLTTASAVVALGVAWVATPALAHLSASPRVRLEGAHVDPLVLLFSLGLAVATGVGFGVIPAFRAWRVNLRDGRLAGGRGTPGTSSLTRRALIGIEVALAIVLLIGAGLMMRTIAALVGVAPGFDPSHVLVVQTSFIGPSFAKNEVTLATQSAVLDQLRAIPGATVVAAAGQTPLDGNFDNYGFHIENRLRGKDGADDPSVERYSVTSDYAKALGIPLVRGRFIETTDTATSQMVLVVSERTAKTLWPGGDPIGARVKVGGLEGPWRTIVGIVGDVRHASLAEAPPMQMYLPQTQFVDTGVAFVVRASGDPMSMAAQARAAIRDAARSVSISSVMSLDELAERSIGPRRFTMGLLVVFALIALTLTSIGIYGVIACTVQERTREIGIRHALGASRASVTRLIMGHGLIAVFIGVVAGVAVGYWSTRLLEPSLYETPSRDPVTMAVAVVVLIVAAVLAHAVPLRRALRINPTVALRSE
jgi:putative ABC transport system permease protein